MPDPSTVQQREDHLPVRKASHPPRWSVRLNLFGVVVYLALIGWLFYASFTAFIIHIEDSDALIGPIIGIVMGSVGLLALVFGAERDPDQ